MMIVDQLRGLFEGEVTTRGVVRGGILGTLVYLLGFGVTAEGREALQVLADTFGFGPGLMAILAFFGAAIKNRSKTEVREGE